MKFEVDNTRYALWILAGKKQFSRVLPAYLQRASMYIMVFDVTRRETFEAMELWVNLARQHHDWEGMTEAEKEFKVFLEGNKVDLPDRQVTWEDGIVLGKRLDVPYLEVSAKTRQGMGPFLKETGLGSIFSLVEELKQEFDEWGD